MRTIAATLGGWNWALGLLVGAAIAAVFLVPGLTDGELDPVDVIGPVSNGAFVGIIVAAVRPEFVAKPRRRWPPALVIALIAAVLTLLVLLPIRLVALALDLEGPWSNVVESTFDVGWRTMMAFVATLGLTVATRSDDKDRGAEVSGDVSGRGRGR